MSKSREDIVCTFFANLTQANFDRAKDFMEKQRLVFISNVWPKSLFDILCDFALAEKNYSDMNFEPAKNKLLVRKEHENYLDFVYKTLFQDLEKLQSEVEDDYVLNLINSLVHYISVRLQLLEFYDKLYEIGLLNIQIDFNELAETIEKIQNEFSNPSPIDGLLKILQYELDGLKYLFKCHALLENWTYIESLLSMKTGSEAIVNWEKCYQTKEAWRFGSLFTNKNTLPALIIWFKKFKLMTVSKFTLYFYGVLFPQTSLVEMRNLCNIHNINFFNKMQLLQRKSECQSVMLVFDTTELPNYNGPGFWCSHRQPVNSSIKYQIMLSFPRGPIKLKLIEKFIIENNEEENSMDKMKFFYEDNDLEPETLSMPIFVLVCTKIYYWVLNFITLYPSTGIEIKNNKTAYLLSRVDVRITFILFYHCKPKSEEREKAITSEFVTQLRCHKIFTMINR